MVECSRRNWTRGTPFASSKSIPGASGKQPTKHVPPRVSQITWNATYARAVKPQDAVFNVNQGTLLEPMVDLFICIMCLVISGIVARRIETILLCKGIFSLVQVAVLLLELLAIY